MKTPDYSGALGEYRPAKKPKRPARMEEVAVMAEVRKMRGWIERYGLAVADKIDRAQWWIDLDLGEVRPPPRGWTFASLVAAHQDDPPGAPRPDFTEEQSRDYRDFWQWYIPLESRVIELCELFAFFAQHRSEHPKIMDDLTGVVAQMYEKYRCWSIDHAIVWLPRRLGWRKGRMPRESVTIVELLSRYLIEYGDTPPEHVTEEVPGQWEAAF